MTMTNDIYSTATCSNCENETRFYITDSTSAGANEYLMIDSGMCIDLSGHYGGFNDSFGDEEMSQPSVLCHDCSLALARVLPGIFKKYSGYHPTTRADGQSCCEFSWKEADDPLDHWVGDGRGGWHLASVLATRF